jgi:hypothetical protein
MSARETDRLAGNLRAAKSKETSRASPLVSDKREDFAAGCPTALRRLRGRQ